MHARQTNGVPRQFSRNAHPYRDDAGFAADDDFSQMVASVAFTGHEPVLDLGTGAGHVVLAFAPFGAVCMGCDIPPQMVEVATQYSARRHACNVRYVRGDEGEHLAVPNVTFAVVTSRFAAHHFGDLRRVLAEVTRVLKRGGRFLRVDPYVPEEESLDPFLDTLERLRDPSHIRNYRRSEFRQAFAQAGLEYHEHTRWDVRLSFEARIEHAHTPGSRQSRLAAHLQGAIRACRETFHLEYDGDAPSSFRHPYVLLHGETS